MFTALPMWAEQQRRNYVPRENSDQRQQRNRGRIDELLATNIQQEQLIDELVITQTQEQRCRKKRIDQLLSEQSKLQREIDALRMQKRELQYMINCSICLTSEHQKVVFLCGHSACWVCSNEINTCHICTRPIMARNPLFLWVYVYVMKASSLGWWDHLECSGYVEVTSSKQNKLLDIICGLFACLFSFMFVWFCLHFWDGVGCFILFCFSRSHV